ncbi:MAG: MG2 domain-containing protein, partial [Rhodoferax sp.]|nr:MG2 domain-containing protein [Rhodoferax sp.]
MAPNIPKIITTLLAAAALQAQALQITSLSPQGEVAQVRQVVAKFDTAAVNFGDSKAPAPLSLSCSDAQAAKGAGRWLSDREWAFEFEADLPPGVRCTVTPVSGFKSASGALLTGTSSYKFNSGGPFIQNLRPGSYQPIDEEQYFVLQLNGPATQASLLQNVWCSVEGLGERVPVRLIDGAERAALLKSQRLDKAAAKDPLRVATLACNRRLTPATKVQLVYGQGVSTPSGVPNSVEKRYNFTVREPFSASFSCERENAQSACLPLRPLRLNFNAPVARQLAEAIRLKSASGEFKPSFDANAGDGDSLVNDISFKPLFAELSQFTLALPAGFKDASGRALANAGSFPMKVATGAMPPLAKFAASPFGILERFAEPGAKPGDPALLPVTLRNVEANLQVKALAAGQVSDLKLQIDADIVAWFRRVQRYDRYQIERKAAAADSKTPLPKALEASDRDYVQSRMVSLLGGQPGVKTLDLPQPAGNDPRPFEVIGIPLSPGFHVVEIASQQLGASLLDERHGASHTMYVRTSALVTNLGVHFKLGRDNALAWVTSLDKGAPVAGAVVRVSSCQGAELAKATTDAQGIARFTGLSSEPPRCAGDDYSNAYFVSARAKAGGVEDMSFTWSDWHKGIEPWRFNVPTSTDPVPDTRVHTIFDRTLFRAGETVAMKHLLRTQTSQGFGLPDLQPDTLVITHTGSGQQTTQPIAWRKTATGGQSAENTFAIPPAAKLGLYDVQLKGLRKTSDGKQEEILSSGQFRVEEF